MVELSDRCTVEDVDSDVYRILEVVLFVPLVVLMLAGAAVVVLVPIAPEHLELAFVSAAGIGLLGLYLVGLAASLLIPALIYIDASSVREADCAWEPKAWLYLVGGFLFSYLILLHYIWKRHVFVVDRVDAEYWWTLFAAAAIGTPGFLALSYGLDVAEAGTVVTLAPLGVAAVFAGLLPIAAYKDATFVRLRSNGWQPNPGNYAAIGLFLWPLAMIIYPLTGAIYFLRRYRNLGSI